MPIKFSSAVYTSSGVKDTVPLDFHKPMNNPATVCVSLTNTPTATCAVEGTPDGSTWFTIPNGGSLSATTVIQVQTAWIAIRLNITSYTAGNIQWFVLQGHGDG